MSRDRDEEILTDMCIEVRASRCGDVRYATSAARLIADASRDHDVAVRDTDLLAERIASGMAALALCDGELVGFGYFSAWEDGRFVSHSGLVVRSDLRHSGLGRQLKLTLIENTRRHYPEAITMSLTSSPQVRMLNLSLGFRLVEHGQLTSDPAFWDGCKSCRNYELTCRSGGRPHCDAMLLRPEWLSDLPPS